jgi:hypothetical protein
VKFFLNAAVFLTLPVIPAAQDAEEPAERADANSRTAPDLIARRWGATDYPQLLENWKINFFGWNAADFG